MNSTRPHILILPRWYPHRYDPMPGLFVRYQAEAIAQHCEVSVLYVHPDPQCPNATETEFSIENGVNVVRVYYLPSRWLLANWRRFYRAHGAGLALLGETAPDLVHVHVLTREGVMGYLIAKKIRIPFVISEHWSRYFPENDFFRSWWKKILTAFIVRKASALIAVSDKLRQAMIAKGLNHPAFHVVPNVLDMERFRISPATSPAEIKTMVHVSCFEDRSKNISGLLEAVKKVTEQRTDFILRLVGDGPDLEIMKQKAAVLGLTDRFVVFTGLKEGEELVHEYRNADFSILSSRFETFGTVVPESLACGTPVLATSVGIAPELVNTSNGWVVPPGNTDALAEGILGMLERCRNFDRQDVRKTVGERFSTQSIAAQLINIYHTVLKQDDV